MLRKKSACPTLLFCLALSWFSAGCGAGRAASPQAQSWRRLELESERLVVYTDVQGPGAREWALSLAEKRAAMLGLVWPNAKRSPATTTVLMFRRPTDAARHLPLGATAAAGRTLLHNGFIVCSPGGPEVQEVIAHELAHELSRWYMPSQPLWFSEGLATFLQTVQYDRSSGLASLGKMPEQVKRAKHLAADRSIQSILDGDVRWGSMRAYGFYVGAYALFANLVNRHEDDFAQFQRELTQIRPWRQAWSKHLSALTPQVLGKELATRGEFSVLTRSVAAVDREVHITPVEPTEMRGWFAAASPDKDVALAEARAALEEDPTEPRALATVLEHSDASAQKKRQLSELFTKAHPENAMSWVLAYENAQTDAEREAASQRAVTLAPFSAGARLVRAKQKLRSGRGASALVDAELAVRLGYANASTLSVYSAALAANSRCEQALQVTQIEVRGEPPKEMERLRALDTPEELACSQKLGVTPAKTAEK